MGIYNSFFILQRYVFFFYKTKYLFIMDLDVNFLITFFKKHTKSESKGEFTEQEASPAGGTAPSTGGGKTPKKWESGRKFGKTYMNDPKYKWTSDRVMGKTYMGDPKYKWTSGRVMGKTGGSDYA